MADPPEVLQRRGGLKGTWQEARQEGARGVGKRSDTDCLLAISFVYWVQYLSGTGLALSIRDYYICVSKCIEILQISIGI